MEPSLLTALIDFVRAESGVVASETITAHTRLQDDLGVYGDDATALLLACAKTFQADISQFMAAEYFDAEGLDVLAWFRPVEARRKQLTVGQLQQGINAKRLDEVIMQRA